MIPLVDGPTTTELSEAALLLALGAILTPQQIAAWLATALQVQAGGASRAARRVQLHAGGAAGCEWDRRDVSGAA